MSRKRRRYRERYSERDFSRRDPEPMWDEAEESWEDFQDADWDDDEAWEEPEGFWEDSGDDRDFPGDIRARSRDDDL